MRKQTNKQVKCCFFSSFQWTLVLSALRMRKQSRAAEFPSEAKTACCQLLRWRAQGRDAAVHMGVFILQQGVHCKIWLQSVEMKIYTCAAETCADWRKVCAKWKDKRFNARETVIGFFKKVLDECWSDEMKQTHQYWRKIHFFCLADLLRCLSLPSIIIWHLVISAVIFLKNVWVFGLVMTL